MTEPLREPGDIRRAYSETATAEEYIDTRFTSAWGTVLHDAQVKVVNDVIRTHGVKRVLEIAPGPARLSRDVSGFDRGYLCEFNDSMLQVARQRLAATGGRWTIVRGDAFRLPFRQAPGLDMVYTFRFVRHFEQADRTALYAQVRSVLKDDGLFVFDAVSVKSGLATRVRDGLESHPIYDEFYDPARLTKELADHGFRLVSLTGVMRHMRLQHSIQVLVAPRSSSLAYALIRGLESIPGNPLEWIVVCKKTGQAT